MLKQDGLLIITSKLLSYMQFKCRTKLPFNNECLELAKPIRQALSVNKFKDYQFAKTTFFLIVRSNP